MKYLYYIVFAVVAVSAAAGYFLVAPQTPPSKTALIINDRVITTDELKRRYASIRPDIKDRDDFINSVITKELLIQESQKSGTPVSPEGIKTLDAFAERIGIATLSR